jgi:hypothetical protein
MIERREEMGGRGRKKNVGEGKGWEEEGRKM